MAEDLALDRSDGQTLRAAASKARDPRRVDQSSAAKISAEAGFHPIANLFPLMEGGHTRSLRTSQFGEQLALHLALTPEHTFVDAAVDALLDGGAENVDEHVRGQCFGLASATAKGAVVRFLFRCRL
jgi:hypothetical protein